MLDLRPHWSFFVGPALLLLAAVTALVAAAVVALHDFVQVALAGVTLAALCWFAGRYARWACTNFVLTSDRLIYRSGVLAKQGIEIPLERINTVFFDQSLVERLLRSGDLIVESGGERGTQHFRDVGRPSSVQNQIHRQIEENQRRATGSRAVGASISDRLAELEELRRRGAVSQPEYDAKRASLLDRL